MKRILAGLVITVVGCLAAACGGAGAEQGKDSTPGQAAAGGDTEATCRESFAKQRTCTDDFLPALVNARIELDLPAGIAAEGKKDGGREALVAKAKEEWAEDSKPEAVAARCKDIDGKVPAEQKAELMAEHTKCLAISDCKAYVECVMPITKKMLSAPK